MTQIAVSVKDVLREMKELKPTSDDVSKPDNDGDDDDSSEGDLGSDLSPEEMKVAELAINVVCETLSTIKEVIRSITGLLKNPKTEIEGKKTVDSLERLLVICRNVRLQVDEIGACLYPPQEVSAIRDASEKMVSFVGEMQVELEKIKGCSDGFVKVSNGLLSCLRELELGLVCSSDDELVTEMENLDVSSYAFVAYIKHDFSGDQAGTVYVKLADCYIKLDSKHEAANAYADAGHCYKKTNSAECISNLEKALDIFMEIGRLGMSARYCKEIAELYEHDQNMEKAMVYYDKTTDLYQGEEVSSSANQCRLKIAQFAAELQQYQKATEIYESIAKESVNNNLLKYGVKGHLLNAGICQLCKGDVVASTNALDKYQEVGASLDEEDVEKFTDAIKEYNSITKLDAWKTTLFFRLKIINGGGKNPEFNEKLVIKINQFDGVLKCEMWMLTAMNCR